MKRDMETGEVAKAVGDEAVGDEVGALFSCALSHAVHHVLIFAAAQGRFSDNMSDTCSEASSSSGVFSFISTLDSSTPNSDGRVVAQVLKYERCQHATKAGKKQTVFIVRVCPPLGPPTSSSEQKQAEWQVSRTYHDFEELHQKLRAGKVLFTAPDKNALTDCRRISRLAKPNFPPEG